MNPDRARALQALNLRYLLKTGAFQFVDAHTPWFPYTSGQIGPYYVQSIAIEKEGDAYADAIQSLVELIRLKFGDFDVVSGGETRDWDFSNPVAVALRKPHIKLYKDGKTLGAEVNDRRVLHVADLNNEGSSIRDHWKPILERSGANLAGFVSYVDRLEEGLGVLQSLGLPFASVVPLDEDAWNSACREGTVTADIRNILVDRFRDRHRWARRTLMTHPEYFKQFASSPKTRDKALKIIRTYPDLAPDLNRMAGLA